MSEKTSWNYDEVVAKMNAEGFRPILVIFARTRRDVHERATEFSFNFPSAFTEADKTTVMDTLKAAFFEQFIRDRFDEAEAERLRQLARHRNN